MSKVTIKIWEKNTGKYWDDETVDFADLVIDRQGNVIYREIHCPDLTKGNEAHFFVNGERIV